MDAEEATEAVTNFADALADIEEKVARLQRLPWSQICTPDLPPLDSARMHLMVAYAVNALFWMYLRARGDLHEEFTVLVRQLPPASDGLPIEIYVFTETTAWVEEVWKLAEDTDEDMDLYEAAEDEKDMDMEEWRVLVPAASSSAMNFATWPEQEPMSTEAA